MPDHYAAFNAVLQSFGDPTRRAVLERLSAGPASVSEPAHPFRMAPLFFMQHLSGLEDSGLAHSRKTGRVPSYELVPRPLQDAERWMIDHRAPCERLPAASLS